MVFCPEFITINTYRIVSPLKTYSTISKVKLITSIKNIWYLCIMALISKSCSYFLVLFLFCAFWVNLLNQSSNLLIMYSGFKGILFHFIFMLTSWELIRNWKIITKDINEDNNPFKESNDGFTYILFYFIHYVPIAEKSSFLHFLFLFLYSSLNFLYPYPCPRQCKIA